LLFNSSHKFLVLFEHHFNGDSGSHLVDDSNKSSKSVFNSVFLSSSFFLHHHVLRTLSISVTSFSHFISLTHFIIVVLDIHVTTDTKDTHQCQRAKASFQDQSLFVFSFR